METKNNLLIKLISLSAGVIFAIGVVIIAFISGEQGSYNQKSYDDFKGIKPDSVTLQSGVVCEKLGEPKDLNTVTVLYSCTTKGVYLEFVNVESLEATQYTTNTDFYTISSGPSLVKVDIIN